VKRQSYRGVVLDSSGFDQAKANYSPESMIANRKNSAVLSSDQ